MTSKIENVKETLANLSETDKDAFKLSGRILAESLLFNLTKVTLAHALGRKIAPNVFKSWGRTFAVVYLVDVLTNRYKLSEGTKETIAHLKLRQSMDKLAEIRKDA